MNFTRKNVETSGTCLQGRIEVPYKTLVEVFGEPGLGDGYKVDAEWDIRFDNNTEDGIVATIYNWKNGKNYCGDQGMDVKDITDWHVGGFSKEALKAVQSILYGYRKVCDHYFE